MLMSQQRSCSKHADAARLPAMAGNILIVEPEYAPLHVSADKLFSVLAMAVKKLSFRTI
jgi:hypothetical protein